MERTHAERILELPRLLDRVAMRCETAFGAEFSRDLVPSFDAHAIRHRMTVTAEALELILRGDLPVYANARDVGQQVLNAAKGATLTGETLFRVGETVGALGRLRKYVQLDRKSVV